MKKINTKMMGMALLVGVSMCLSSCNTTGQSTEKTELAASQSTSAASSSTTPAKTSSSSTANSSASATSSQTATVTGVSSASTSSPSDVGMGSKLPHRVSAVLPSGWTEVKTQAGIESFFDHPISDFDQYVYAAESELAKLYVFGVIGATDWEAMLNMSAQYSKATEAEGLEVIRERLLKNGYSESELNTFQRIADGEEIAPEEQNFLITDLTVNQYLRNVASKDAMYELYAIKPIELGEQRGQSIIFLNSDEQGGLDRYEDANIIIDGQFYVISFWSKDADFENAQADLSGIVKSLKFVKK